MRAHALQQPHHLVGGRLEAIEAEVLEAVACAQVLTERVADLVEVLAALRPSALGLVEQRRGAERGELAQGRLPGQASLRGRRRHGLLELTTHPPGDDRGEQEQGEQSPRQVLHQLPGLDLWPARGVGTRLRVLLAGRRVEGREQVKLRTDDHLVAVRAVDRQRHLRQGQALLARFFRRDDERDLHARHRDRALVLRLDHDPCAAVRLGQDEAGLFDELLGGRARQQLEAARQRRLPFAVSDLDLERSLEASDDLARHLLLELGSLRALRDRLLTGDDVGRGLVGRCGRGRDGRQRQHERRRQRDAGAGRERESSCPQRRLRRSRRSKSFRSGPTTPSSVRTTT